MNIKIEQLDEHTRLTIANALLEYYPETTEEKNPSQVNTHELSARIAAGEVLLCKYVDNQKEE